jgi:hypothetical protein
MHYSTEPSQIEISGATISMKITRANAEWEVTALLARCPPTVPIDSADVKIVAYDVTGAAMPVRYRPVGLTTEVGGSLSTTVNATFRFAGSEPPNEVVVEWASRSARFRVIREAKP